MSGTTLLIGLGAIVGALLVGELIFRKQSGTVQFFGDLSQAIYATFGLVIVIMLAFGGGVYTVLAFVFIILYYALARKKWFDVRSTNLRAALNGQDK